jgi:hypothetical protein
MTKDRMEQEQLSQLLRELAAHDEGILPPTRVQATVMGRWNERIAANRPALTVSPRQAARPVQWTPARTSLSVAGIAAMVLLAVWVEIRPTGQPIPTVPPPAPAIAEARRDPIRRVPEIGELRRQPGLERPGKSELAPARTAAAPAATESEPFVRLLPMTEQELGTIRLARVRLRGQAARTLGLEARMPLPGADGFVEADVLLGEDGLARAIRFVR